MPFDYDILITGAGPAGCAAAYDLAQAGLRVVLLDKRTFPRPKACACGLTRKTLTALRYSVDPIIERTCHEIVLQHTPTKPGAGAPHLDSEMWASTNVRVRTRTPIAAMAVRERFDHFCLQQTLNAGAHLRKIDSILAIRELPTHIELEIATPEGTETLTAPVLIGADGSNGQTRRLTSALALQQPGFSPSGGGRGLQAPDSDNVASGASAPEGVPAEPTWYTRGFALEACVPYTTLPSPLPAGDHPHDLVFDFDPLPGGYGWLFPKGDHINIGVGTFADGSDTELKKVTRQLLTTYTTQKLGVSLTHINAAITGQYLGMGGHGYPPRGRVLLTGDAAGLVDPLTGEGIHSAIVSGQAAAAAILETLHSPTDLSSRPKAEGRSGETRISTATDLAATYARHLLPLQQTLAFSARAARSFYRTPERGMKAMRTPILRSLILKTYADGLPHTKLISTLAKLFT